MQPSSVFMLFTTSLLVIVLAFRISRIFAPALIWTLYTLVREIKRGGNNWNKINKRYAHCIYDIKRARRQGANCATILPPWLYLHPLIYQLLFWPRKIIWTLKPKKKHIHCPIVVFVFKQRGGCKASTAADSLSKDDKRPLKQTADTFKSAFSSLLFWRAGKV